MWTGKLRFIAKLWNTALYLTEKNKQFPTKNDDITFSKKKVHTSMALVKIYTRLENKWQYKKAMLSALGVAPKNIPGPRGPLQFSCSRSRNALIKFM